MPPTYLNRAILVRARLGATLLLLLCVCFGALAMRSDLPRASADHGPLVIAGIRSGMTGPQVRHKLGRPARKTTRSFYHRVVEWQWHYPARLTVGFERFGRNEIHRVFRVRTRSPRDLFPGNIHVGSRESAMRHEFVGATCGYHSRRSETMPRGFVCEWGQPLFVCGPRFVFYMRHRHRRVNFIELWGMPRNYLMRASPLLTLSLRPIAMRGCF